MVAVVEVLSKLGGVATWGELIEATTRSQVEAAIGTGAVIRSSHGRYALPSANQARVAAHRVNGTAILLSAAAHWGWRTKWQPRQPQVAVPRGRRVPKSRRDGVALSWRGIPTEDVVDGWVTSRVRTVLDCAAGLPFDEALAVADSALAGRGVTLQELQARALALPARGPRTRILRVVRAANPLAANPFESVLRAIAMEVPGLLVRPQHRIDVDGRFVARVDLADLSLRIVLEADSMEFHGLPELMEKDCKRYDELVADDWLVLRFSWMQVMAKPAWVADVIARTVQLRQRQQLRRSA